MLPTVLYHYTTFPAVASIFREKTLRATDIRYLNDGAEFSRGLHELVKQLRERPETATGGSAQFLKDIADSYEKYALSVAGGNSPRWGTQYVTCFSEAKDSLALWTRYGSADAGGIALHFSFCDSSPLADYPAVACAYEDERSIERIGSLVSRLIKNIQQSIHPKWGLRSDDRDDETNNVLWESTSLCSTFKHRAFSDEHEWRIVIDGRYSNLPVCHRGGAGMLIPYVEIKLSPKEQPLPIVGATIGPSPYANLARESVIDLFRNNGLHAAADSVVVSEASFRVLGR